MMLEEGINLHRFAGILPEQLLTEAGCHRDAVVAADQRMVIRCFGDNLACVVHDVSHVTPPIQRADQRQAMVRSLSNVVPAPGVPTHDDHGFRIRHAPHSAPPLCTNPHINLGRYAKLQIRWHRAVARSPCKPTPSEGPLPTMPPVASPCELIFVVCIPFGPFSWQVGVRRHDHAQIAA